MIAITKVDGNWKLGTVNGKEFQAKVYEEPSKYGIQKGNISKLWIKGVCHYDRGWDEKPTTKESKDLVSEIVEYFMNPEHNRCDENYTIETEEEKKLKELAKKLGYTVTKN